MRFSATEAVFEGFRLIQKRPSVLIWWTLGYLAFFAICGAIVATPLVTFFQQAQILEGREPTSYEEIRPMLTAFIAMFALIFPLGLLGKAIIYAAVARGVLQPGKGAWGYLRLGADELRVLGVTLILGFLMMALWCAIVFATMTVIGVGTAMNAPLLYLLATLLFLAGVGLLIWLSVRLSLAVPLVIDRQQMNVFGSFGLTKGKFWPLLGMSILTAIIVIVVSMIFSLVIQPFMLLLGPGLQSQVEAIEDPAELITLMQSNLPLLAIFLVSNAVSTALTVAVQLAPFSAAYRDLTRPGSED